MKFVACYKIGLRDCGLCVYSETPYELKNRMYNHLISYHYNELKIMTQTEKMQLEEEMDKHILHE